MQDENTITYRFLSAVRKMHRYSCSTKLTGATSRGGFDILTVVEYHERRKDERKVRLGEICTVLNRSMPSVTRSVNELERQGLIERSFSPHDRRLVFIGLTEQGRAAVEESKNSAIDTVGAMLDRLGHDDAEELVKLLERAGDTLFQIVRENADDETTV